MPTVKDYADDVFSRWCADENADLPAAMKAAEVPEEHQKTVFAIVIIRIDSIYN
jgi:hypothetical protein